MSKPRARKTRILALLKRLQVRSGRWKVPRPGKAQTVMALYAELRKTHLIKQGRM